MSPAAADGRPARDRARDGERRESAAYDPRGERSLLVVLPHPDDESFAAGGTLAKAHSAGVPTTYLCGTFGDMGRRMGRPAFTNREALRDVRARELRAACDLLGCDLIFLGLRDKCVEFEDPAEVAARIREVIEETAASAVITFYPGYGVHPDHDALGRATVLAVNAMEEAKRPRLLAVAVGEREQLAAELGEPHLSCDIAEFGEVKLAALRAHRSQTEAMFAQFERGEGGEFHEEFTKRERFYLLDPEV